MYTKYVRWLREASQIGKTFIPLHVHVCEQVVLTQHGRIPIDPAILAAIGHCFMAKKERKKLIN